MKNQRIISMLLLAAIAASTLACGEQVDDGKETSSSSGGDVATEDTTEAGEKLDLPENLNYENYTFRILSRPNGRLDEVYTEESVGETLSDAVYKRNDLVEEKLNIKFQFIESSSDWETDAMTSIMADEDAYDAVATAARAAFVYAANDVVYDWNEIENVDLTKSWWNQDASTSLAINNKIYAMMGDISYATLGASVGMLFNKSLLEDYHIDYPYELVDNGTWTFDTFAEMVRNYSQDLNNDGKMDIADDLFGYAANHWCGPIEALYSTGNRIITTNKDGYPELTLYNEKTVDIYDKYMELLLSDNCWNQLGGNNHQQAFCDGRMAFVDINISHLSESFFRDAEIEFGLVPWPKSEESVDKYYSFVDAGHTLWVIPVTNSDTARTGAVLEMMAYYGQQIIIPAYYDITLQNKYLRDDRSVDMLNYIKDGAIFDLGYYNNSQFGGDLANPGWNLVHDTTLSFTTLYNTYEQSVKALIDKSMDSYLAD